MTRRSRKYRVMLVAITLMAMATAAPISMRSSNAPSSTMTLTTRSITSSSRATTSARIVTSYTSAKPSTVGSRSSTANLSASRSTNEASKGGVASTSIKSKPSSVRSANVKGTESLSHSTARKVSTTRSAKSTKPTSTRKKTSSRTIKSTSHHIIKTSAHSTHVHTSSSRIRSAKSTVTRAHSTRSHTHTHTSVSHALHTPHHKDPTGDKIISHPIPGSTWERVRKILLIPLSIMTVLTFLAGIGLYIAATWGSGEGWFGKDLNGGEKLGGTPGDIKVLVEEKKKQIEMHEGTEEKREVEAARRNSDGSFQFRVPSLDGDPAKQS